MLQWEGFKLLPAVGSNAGCDVLKANYDFFGSDLLLTLCDPFALLPAVEDLARMRTAIWFPVDCQPVGQPDVTVLREALGVIPVAMSRFGERMLRDEGTEPLYVPHAVDTELFSPGDPAPFRDSIGAAPETMVIGINAMNRDPVRKGLPEQFEAFARFHHAHPDSILVVHAQPENKSGLNLNQLALQLGISHAVSFPDTYRHAMFMITQENMAGWYRGLDVFSLCSYGEGFGIPLLEAQACSIPVVTTDASATSELCGAGWLVSGTRWWHHNHNAWWKRPDPEDIYHAYEMAYEAKLQGRLPKEQAREFALQYDADRVLKEYWTPALGQIAERAG